MGGARAGALVGVLYLAKRDSVVGLGHVIANCALGLGTGLVALELAPATWAAVPLFFVIGGSRVIEES